MNIQRLTILRDFLRNLPPESRAHFDLNTWMTSHELSYGGELAEPLIREPIRKDSHYHHIQLDGEFIKGHCGTSACALGWACSIPEFQAQGLQMSAWKSVYDGGLSSFEPIFQQEVGVHAGELFFGLTAPQAYYLFIPETYRQADGYTWIDGDLQVTPDDVAARIDDLLKGAVDDDTLQELYDDAG